MIDRLRIAIRRVDGFLRRTQAGIAAYRAASPEHLDELDRAVLLRAVLRPMASVLEENSILRGVVSVLAARRRAGEPQEGEGPIAQEGAVAAAEERTKRGDFEGDA